METGTELSHGVRLHRHNPQRMETGMKGSFTTRKGTLCCIVMTCLCSLLATGCASKYGAQMTDVHYYPDCYQPIADLRSAEKSFNTTMVMGTTMGALLGAVIGEPDREGGRRSGRGRHRRGSRSRGELSRRQIQQREGRPRPPRQLCPRPERRRQLPEPRNRRRTGGV